MSEPMTEADLDTLFRHAEYGHLEGQDYDLIVRLVAEVRRLRDGYADLVEAAREVCTPVRPSEAVEARLRACLARIDELEKGGA